MIHCYKCHKEIDPAQASIISLIEKNKTGKGNITANRRDYHVCHICLSAVNDYLQKAAPVNMGAPHQREVGGSKFEGVAANGIKPEDAKDRDDG